ncbi:helix-turn-helix domain-containing protein [Desulfocucumis palustris]|uniref:helix-turn-helix domain-containing protein n=1 Tax=Desulfocucumis palustris TaxID=1898651 RepID=UPI001A9A68D6|nr:helix-turn-helix transcriptional regulator [Desulfocucumis palustris]
MLARVYGNYAKLKDCLPKELDEITSISQPVINRLETNNRFADVAYIEIICNALGITLAEFFTEDRREIDPKLRRLLETAKKLTAEQRDY